MLFGLDASITTKAHNLEHLLTTQYAEPDRKPTRDSCACSFTCQRLLQARSLFLQEWGLIDLPLRAAFSPAHPLARRDVPLARARAFHYLSLPLGEWPRRPFTARIERPLLYRGGSASKKGTWPLRPHPSEAARCASTEDYQPPSPLCSGSKRLAWVLRSLTFLRARRTVWLLPSTPSEATRAASPRMTKPPSPLTGWNRRGHDFSPWIPPHLSLISSVRARFDFWADITYKNYKAKRSFTLSPWRRSWEEFPPS